MKASIAAVPLAPPPKPNLVSSGAIMSPEPLGLRTKSQSVSVEEI